MIASASNQLPPSVPPIVRYGGIAGIIFAAIWLIDRIFNIRANYRRSQERSSTDSANGRQLTEASYLKYYREILKEWRKGSNAPDNDADKALEISLVESEQFTKLTIKAYEEGVDDDENGANDDE